MRRGEASRIVGGFSFGGYQIDSQTVSRTVRSCRTNDVPSQTRGAVGDGDFEIAESLTRSNDQRCLAGIDRRLAFKSDRTHIIVVGEHGDLDMIPAGLQSRQGKLATSQWGDLSLGAQAP